MKETESGNTSSTQIRLLLFAVIGLGTALAFFNLLRLFVGPLFIAILLAYLTDPLFARLEARGIKRSWSVSIALIFTTLAGTVLGWILLPIVIAQFEIFFQILPQAFTTLKSSWLPRFQEVLERNLGPEFKGLSNSTLAEIIPFNQMKTGEMFWSGLGAGTQILGTIAMFIIATPTFSFLLMRDYRQIRSRLGMLIPLDLRPSLRTFAHEVDHTVRSVLSGQILVICLLSVLYSTAFFLAGLPGGLAIGILTGISRIIPYLDVIIGGTLSFLILVTNGAPVNVVMGVVLSFVVIQLIDGLFLTPRIVGQFAGLHPVAIIIAVLVCADRFGFYGVLLAIPVTAVGRILLINLIRSYRASRYYLAG
jgi:predicted PurR-regulated permease PerM